MPYSKNILCLALLGLLSGCQVGPDFSSPPTDLPDQWGDSRSTISASSATDVQWWATLQDTQLQDLVARAKAANLDVQTAAVRLEMSKLARQVTAGDSVPSVAAVGSYDRSRNSKNGLSDPSGESGRAPFELWTAALDASWELDLWGRIGRNVEAADAQIAVTAAQRDGILLSIAAETASSYIRLRGVQQKIAVATENLKIARQSHDLTQTRLDNGVTTNLDTSNSAAQVSTILAVLPKLEAEQDRLINRLSFLLAEPPQALRSELISPKAIPASKSTVLIGLPSDLARRRPDIQESEAALHRATAAIGVAQADFYPRVTLGARFGTEALAGSDIGSWGSREWSYGPALYLPIFQGGRLTGTLNLRKREHQAAAIDYQRVVLKAWHEVDDAISDYSQEQKRVEALREAVRQNDLALKTAQDRYAQGAVDFLNVLSVQQARLKAQSDLVDSETLASLSRVKLYRAVGGGWPKQ